MLQQILVALDSSEPSGRALDLGAVMAEKFDATLQLLHVIRNMQLPPELRKMAEVEKIAGERADVLRFVGNRILKDSEGRAKAHGALRVTTALGDGDPATAILDYAKANNSELIILGTRGLGELKGLMLGSVSRKVSNLSPINVLIVR